MSKLTQKEAVFQAVSNVLSEQGITIEEGTNVSTFMTREVRSQVNQILVEGFKAGNIELDKSYDESGLKAYVSGLQSNWIRKDKRLNGGISYIAKNPGSRTGSGDSQLKAMKTLLSTLTPETPDYFEVQEAINTRVAELNAAKVKSVSINFDALPEALKAKFSK